MLWIPSTAERRNLVVYLVHFRFHSDENARTNFINNSVFSAVSDFRCNEFLSRKCMAVSVICMLHVTCSFQTHTNNGLPPAIMVQLLIVSVVRNFS